MLPPNRAAHGTFFHFGACLGCQYWVQEKGGVDGMERRTNLQPGWKLWEASTLATEKLIHINMLCLFKMPKGPFNRILIQIIAKYFIK